MKWFDWRQETDTAYAWLGEDDQPLVIIPYPKSLATFYVCLHEIGHIVRSSSFSDKHAYVSEYKAETWAIDYCRNKLGINPVKEERFAKAYVLGKLLKQWRRSVHPENVRKDILKWLSVSVSELDMALVYKNHFLRHYKRTGKLT